MSGHANPEGRSAPLTTSPGPVLVRILTLADRPMGIVVLVMLALLEATIFPGPTEAMLIALTLGRRKRAWWFAGIATAASAVGGVIGYKLGATFFPEVARPLLEAYGLTPHVEAVQRVYADNMMIALVTSGYTPIPYMLYTIMAGAASLPLVPFIAGSLVGRAIKYFPIAALAYLFGPTVHRLLSRYGRASVLVIVAALLAYLLLRA